MYPLIRFRVILILLVGLLAASGAAQQTQGQIMKGKERSVEKLSRKPMPLKVKVIKTNKGEFLLGQKLIDDDDWFQGLSIVLENNSGKTIIYIGAGFLFPRQDGEIEKAPPLYKSLSYGQHPSAPNGTAMNAQPLALKPGEIITIALSDSDYDEVTSNLRRLEYAKSVKSIKFNLQEVYFDDGTGWAVGTWLRRDPSRPEIYIRDQRPISGEPNNFPTISSYSFRNPNAFPSSYFLKAI